MFIIKRVLVVIAIAVIGAGIFLSTIVREKTMEVPNPAQFKTVEIQTIVKNKEVKSKTVTIDDTKTIQTILNAVDGMKTKESSISKTEKEVAKVDSYFFYFENKDKRDTENPLPYSLFITSDGTVFFTHKKLNALMTPQRSVEKHPEILEEIKKAANLE